MSAIGNIELNYTLSRSLGLSSIDWKVHISPVRSSALWPTNKGKGAILYTPPHAPNRVPAHSWPQYRQAEVSMKFVHHIITRVLWNFSSLWLYWYWWISPTSLERDVYCPNTHNFKLPCYYTQTSNDSQYFL